MLRHRSLLVALLLIFSGAAFADKYNNTVQLFKDAGASEVYAVCTHGVFAQQSLERIRDSEALSGIACTNTRPHVQALADGDFLRVYSVADLIAQFLSESV